MAPGVAVSPFAVEACSSGNKDGLVSKGMDCEGTPDSALSLSLCSSPRASSSLSSSVSSDSLSESEALQFTPQVYLAMHRKAIAERVSMGAAAPKMRLLYRCVAVQRVGAGRPRSRGARCLEPEQEVGII